MSKPKHRCLHAVRELPLERFRLATDGRSWKFIASRRYDFLCNLAGRANPDGTFIGKDGTNYSPSEIRLSRHTSEATMYRRTDELNELGLLSWTREKNHAGRRIYVIHFDEHLSSSSENTSQVEAEHLSSSEGTPLRLETKEGEHLSSSQITPLSGDRYPSYPPKERTDKAIRQSVATDETDGLSRHFSPFAGMAEVSFGMTKPEREFFRAEIARKSLEKVAMIVETFAHDRSQDFDSMKSPAKVLVSRWSDYIALYETEHQSY